MVTGVSSAASERTSGNTTAQTGGSTFVQSLTSGQNANGVASASTAGAGKPAASVSPASAGKADSAAKTPESVESEAQAKFRKATTYRDLAQVSRGFFLNSLADNLENKAKALENEGKSLLREAGKLQEEKRRKEYKETHPAE